MLTILTVLLAGAAASTAAQKVTPASLVGPHLSQVRAFAADEGDRVWPGYGTAPFGFLLVTKGQETLLCRDTAPTGFAAGGTEPFTGCKQFTRPATGLPGNLLAAMPIFGPPSAIVMGTPEGTGRTEASWLRTILHEHFHQWQNALPDYYSRAAALDLSGGDETGMWMLNFTFPYEDPEVIAAFNEASLKLADAVAARATPQFAAAFDNYLIARQALANRAGERN